MSVLNSRQRICVNCLTTFNAPKKECDQCGQPITAEFKSLYNEVGLGMADIIYFAKVLAIAAVITLIAYFAAPENGSLNKNFVTVIPLLSLFFALLLRTEYRWKTLGNASLNWPKTEGEVIISQVYMSGSDFQQNIAFGDTDSEASGPSFHQLIVCKYSVNDVKYATGNVRYASTSLVSETHSTKMGGARLSISDHHGSEDLNKYTVGTIVEVSYDSNDHQASGEKFTHVKKNAVIEPGYDFFLFSWNVIGILLMPLVAIMVLYLIFN